MFISTDGDPHIILLLSEQSCAKLEDDLTSVLTSFFLTSPSCPSLLQLGWIPTMKGALRCCCSSSGSVMQSSFRVVSRSFDIPRSFVHEVVHRVSPAIIRILRRVIAFPTGDDLVAQMPRRFYHLPHLPIQRACTEPRSVFLKAMEVSPGFVPEVIARA